MMSFPTRLFEALKIPLTYCDKTNLFFLQGFSVPLGADDSFGDWVKYQFGMALKEV